MRLPESTRIPPWAEYLLLSCFAFLLLQVGNNAVSLWDRDEPRYAETARQMYQTGDWIVPYFNHEFRFQKPVLTYWLVAASYAVFGETVFASRITAGLSVAAAAALVAFLGNRMFGRPAGFLAFLTFLLCPVTFLLGKLCIPDGPQLFFGTVCFLSLWHIVDAKRDKTDTRRWAFFFWLAMGLAILTKGPIIPGMVAMTVALYCLATRTSPVSFPLRWRVGVVVLACVTVPWFFAIYHTAGNAFYSEAVGRQIGGRLKESFDGKLLPPGYYVGSLLLGFAPWTVVVLHAAIRWRRRMFEPGPHSFLMAWIIGPLVLLELFRSKQIHYHAPAYPALALLIGGYFSDVVQGKSPWVSGRHARVFNGFWGGANLVVALAFVAIGWFGPQATQVGCFAIAALQLTGGLLSTYLFVLTRPLAGLLLQSGTLAVLWIMVGGLLLPGMEQSRILPTVSSRLREEQTRSHRPVVLHQIMEPSLIFYSGLELPEYFEDDDFVRRLEYTSDETITLLSSTAFDRLQTRLHGRLRILESWNGWVKMHPETVHLCVHEPHPAMVSQTNEDPVR